MKRLICIGFIVYQSGSSHRATSFHQMQNLLKLEVKLIKQIDELDDRRFEKVK
jgi:hypothetical protein